jgi:glycosyltransferase involved in cell wall biosynthesis
MKFLHVTDDYTPQGGVQQYIVSVACLLAEHGHDGAILHTEQSELTIRNGLLPAYHIAASRVDVVAQMEKVLGIERPDVAYIHHVSSPALIELLAGRVPAIAYVHGFTAVCPGLGKYFRRGDTVCERPFGWGCVPMHYLRRCSAARRPSTLSRLMSSTAALRQALFKLPRFLVGSRYMADLLAQNGFSAEKISILPPHFFADGTIPAYKPPQEPKSVLFAGRLEIEKGFPYLLQALALLPADVRLVVAGDGTQRLCYESLARDIRLEGRTEFLGWLDRESMQRVYERCSVAAMPSVFPESFGKAGVEALAHGRPVIAFDVGGISDWLEDGVNGYLVAPKDSRGLARRIDQLIQDEGMRTRMGRAAQTAVVQKYSAHGHLTNLLTAVELAIRRND